MSNVHRSYYIQYFILANAVDFIIRRNLYFTFFSYPKLITIYSKQHPLMKSTILNQFSYFKNFSYIGSHAYFSFPSDSILALFATVIQQLFS